MKILKSGHRFMKTEIWVSVYENSEVWASVYENSEVWASVYENSKFGNWDNVCVMGLH